ncbi:MAG: glutathione transferase GstA [Povalibacter sp.]
MKLYYSRGACSLAPNIVLHEVGVSFERIKVDPKTKLTEHGIDFHQINPNGYVPVLELDSGERLTEAAVILQYIGDQYPQFGLTPPMGGMAHYRLIEWLNFISSEIHKAYSVLFHPETPQEYKTATREKLALRLAHVEHQLAATPYLMGDAFSVADAYLFVVTNWSRVMMVDLAGFPQLQQFQSRMAKRPSVQAAMKSEGLLK